MNKLMCLFVLLFCLSDLYAADKKETVTGRMSRWNGNTKIIGIKVVDTKDKEESWFYKYDKKTVVKDKTGNVVEMRKLLGRYVTAICVGRKVISITGK